MTATQLNHILSLNQNTSATPIVSQASGLTAFRSGQTPGNLIIRPQIIGQQTQTSTTTAANNSTPQLIQIQTPNGPILLSVNLNSSQQQPSQPQIQPPPAPPPQTFQIDNTLFSLTTNPVSQQQQQQPPTALNLGGGALSQTILTNQSHHQQLSTTHHLHQQSLSTHIQHQQQQTSSANNQKNQTTITKPKTQNPTKGLNLADLLKETGILTDFSPPSSPVPTTQTTQTKDNSATILVDPSNTTTRIPSSQSQTVLMVSNPANSNLFLSQQQSRPNSTTTTAGTISSVVPSLQSQTQQLRISLTPDGTLVLLSPNSNTLFPTTTTTTPQQGQNNNLTATSIMGQSKNSNKQQQQTLLNDSSGLGSSQPSPDSTTPSIDTGSCSSPSIITTQTQSLTTQTINSIDSCHPKLSDNNTVDETVVSSLSSSSLKTSISSTTFTTTTTTTTTTCTAETSQSMIKPSHPTTTSIVISQQPTLPIMTSSQTTTYTTVLIPGTIMFLNDKRIPIATLNRTNQISELMHRLDNQIRQQIGQQKDIQQELQQLQQTLSLIQSQPIIPSQIPQVKISDKVAQVLQVSTWATQQTQIKTSTPTIAVVNHQSIALTTMSTLTTTTTTTPVTNNTPTTVKFVLGPNINSNPTIQLVHSIPNSSQIIQSPLKPSITTGTATIQSSDIKTKTPSTSPVATTPIIIKQEKPKSNVLKA
ncbi:hypothetical protein BLA29_002989 [Euroglyphus maynei]|uniref:Uncharacterized protein n=1 Tax=Euroglyphus maynei TaxID=6958 RepID=A0A1Y3BLD3_EURMA|nr:hypothetical protein BLA29_002989 [Euroglyphus maynei]